MNNLKKCWNKRMAFMLCVILVMTVVDVPGQSLPAKAAQGDAGQLREQQMEFSAGELAEINVYEETDVSLLDVVPSYESAASRYGRRARVLSEDGTGDYGYRSLTADQQELYQSLEMSLRTFRELDAPEFQQISYGYTPFKVSYDVEKLDSSGLEQTWIAFLADHPSLFWLSSMARSQTTSGGRKQGYVMPLVTQMFEEDLTTIKAMEQKVEEGAREYMDAVSGVEDTYEKVRIIYDKIIREIDYAYKADGTTPESADWAHTIVGVFDDSYKAAVCEGYSKTLAYLLNRLDVPNVYILGTVPGGSHAWNAVSFDGGTTYYYMDVTWDDRGKGDSSSIENYYGYFAMPKDSFEKRHKPFTTSDSGMSWQYELPTMGNDMSYTYFVRYASYAAEGTVYDTESAKTFLKKARTLSPEGVCVLLLPDQTALTLISRALNMKEISFSSVKEYSMLLFVVSPDDSFCPQVCAAEFTLSASVLTMEQEEEREVYIQSATEGNDDLITFYSSDDRVAVVKTPYVEAKEGEHFRITATGGGTACIYAKSAGGGTTAVCTVTVQSSQGPVETLAPESPIPSASPMPSKSPVPSAEPTEEASMSPEPVETHAPSASPMSSESPVPSTSSVPSTSPTPSKSPVPSAEPTEEASMSPEPVETHAPSASSVPSASPMPSESPIPSAEPTEEASMSPEPVETHVPSASPMPSESPMPSAEPTEEASMSPEPVETLTPSASANATQKPGMPPEAGTSNGVSTESSTPVPTSEVTGARDEQTLEKGDLFLAGNLRYRITKITGKRGELAVVGIKSKQVKTIVIPNKVRKNGVAFIITSIEKNAFRGCRKAKTLSIKSVNIKKVAKKALAGLDKKLRIQMPQNRRKTYLKLLNRKK